MRNLDARIKGLLILTFSGIAVAVLVPHRTGSLWPAVPALAIGVGVPATIVCTRRYGTQGQIGTILLAIIALAIFVRLYPAVFAATLPGNDPHKYAVAVYSVLENGTTEGIYLDFYRDVPVFVLLAATVAIVTGSSAWSGLLIYPLLGGLLALLGYVLVRTLESSGRTDTPLLAALLSAVALGGVRFASQPIANFLATLLFVVVTISLVRYSRSRSIVDFAVLFVVSIALVFTHKLAPVFLAGLFVGTALLARIRSVSGRATAGGRQRLFSGSVLALGLIVGLLQWTIITEFATRTVLRLVTFTIGGESSDVPPPTAARAVSDSLWHFVYRRLHGLVLLPLASLSAAALVFRRRDYETTVIVGVSTAIIAFIPVAVLDPGTLNPVRMLISIEPLLIALVCLAIGGMLRRDGTARHLAVALVVVILVSQAGTAFFVGDAPGENRAYLTEQETEAKAFAAAAEGDVAADPFYADQAVNLDRASEERSWEPFHEEVFNGDTELDSQLVAYRSEGEPYRTYQPWTGRWVPTYDVERTFDTEHNRVYSNEQVRFYANSSSTVD